MDKLESIFSALRDGLGLTTLLVLALSVILRQFDGRPGLQKIATGLLFGLGTLVAMVDQDTYDPASGIDARLAIVAVAIPFGGACSATITVLIAMMPELLFPDTPSFAVSLLPLCLAVLAGLAFRATVRTDPEAFRWKHLGVLAALASVAGLAPVLSGKGQLLDVASVLSAQTFLGVLGLSALLIHEKRRVRAEAVLAHEARTDPLTELLNRRAFNKLLLERCERAERGGETVSVLLMDVDGFKAINDNHGHSVGDEILATIGQVLTTELSQTGFAARLGGDEFVACTGASDAESLKALALRLRRSIQLATKIVSGVDAKVSVGASSWSALQSRPADLLKAADRALYDAKRDIATGAVRLTGFH